MLYCTAHRGYRVFLNSIYTFLFNSSSIYFLCVNSPQLLDGAHYLCSLHYLGMHSSLVSPHCCFLTRCLQSSSTHVLPSFTSSHASLLALLHLTCCFSPLFPLRHSSPCCLQDIMSNHYLRLSCCSSPSIYPLSLPSTPPRLSPLDRATYYLHHSLHSSFL